MVRIRITDDGGPILGRLAVLLPDSAIAAIRFGDVELAIAGTGDAAAARCRTIAGEFQRLALELLNAGRRQPLDARAHAGDGAGAAREAGAVHGIDNTRGDEDLS